MYQFGVGLAFIATVRADGGPRMHPMCPLINEEGLYAFMIPSPKQRDLHRDPRYAMHSFPADANEDAFYLIGEALPLHDMAVRAALEAQFLDERAMTERPPEFDAQELFQFAIDRCLFTRTIGHGDPAPSHMRWHAP
jgi:hypothetical protein